MSPQTPSPAADPLACWPQPDGTPIACREKLRVLAENQAELQAMLRDVFDDAVLMGVDETAMRRILVEWVQALPGPLQRRDPGPDPA